MASMAATMVAPEASMVASMALLVPSLASMVASLDRLRLMIEPKSGEERADGLIKIKIDGDRVESLTRKIREE